MPSFDQTPDLPDIFGYKIAWLALKAPDPASVVDALELQDATPANWASGLAAVHDRESPPASLPWLFVSPAVSGWVLVVGSSLPYPTEIDRNRSAGQKFELLLSRCMKRFADVQYFASHRVIDFYAWARALDGRPIRIFCYGGGEVAMNFGDQTPEEANLGFHDLSGLSGREAVDRLFALAAEQDDAEERLIQSGLSRREARAKVRKNGRDPLLDEEDVLDLAGQWSINPMELANDDHPPGLGLAARLPKHLME